MKLNHAVMLATFTLLFADAASASILWHESINGDLSNSSSAPTTLPALTLGPNRIVGSIGAWWSSDDGDVATFTVPPGFLLSNVILESYNDMVYYDYVPFILYRGASTSGQEIEFILFGEQNVGTDLLDFDSKPGPQPAGDYTFRFHNIETDNITDERSTYTVNLTLSEVPEPATLSLLAFGGLVGIGRRALAKRW